MCLCCVQLNVQYTLVPNSYPNLPTNGLPYPSEAPPNITNDICSAQFFDNMSTRDRYIMVVKFLIGQVSDLLLHHAMCGAWHGMARLCRI